MNESVNTAAGGTADNPAGVVSETPPIVSAAPPASDKQKKVRALVRVSHNGETYEPDEIFSVGGKQLQALLDVKAVKTA